MMRPPFRAVVAILSLAAVLLLAFYQGEVRAAPAGLEGQVTDLSTGNPLPGARLSAGQSQAVADARGYFALDLPEGTYDVRIEAPGYIGMTHGAIIVPPTAIIHLDVQMIPESPSPAQARAIDAQLLRAGQASAQAYPDISAFADPPDVQPLAEAPTTIQVLMPDGQMVTMEMEEYLRGVVPHEMPPSWPTEALKAQAVAARSFAARRQADVGYVCTTTNCQVWKPVYYDSTDRAIRETAAMTAQYEGSVIRAFYFTHSDGRTRNSEEVWGGYLPYCRSVASPCGYDYMRGHGVGMSQYGARNLALQGLNYDEILKHYYTGIEVVGPNLHRLTDLRVAPVAGDARALYAFEATYVTSSSQPPAAALVVIDGRAHTLNWAPGADAHTRTYRLETALAAGSHSHYFYFDDGQGQTIRMPPEGAYDGPVVAAVEGALIAPTPTPIAGVVSSSITQATVADFGTGTLDGLQILTLREGALTLAVGHGSGVYTSAALPVGSAFEAFAVSWHGQTPPGTAVSIEVRASVDGKAWGDWHVAERDEHRRDTDDAVWFSEITVEPGALLQYRATLATQSEALPLLEHVQLVGFDGSHGPTAEELQPVRTSNTGEPYIIPRRGWGANEALMTWLPEYTPVKAVVVHHTATSDGGQDPAAMVRTIYYYHAITRQWGDIGYNYLVDTFGNVYEGRYGGEGVIGGHASRYNPGSIGVSLIGDFTATPVPPAMFNGLTSLLAWKSARHWLDPVGSTFLIDRELPTIMGHRDVAATACPGAQAYALLPQVRATTRDKMVMIPGDLQLLSPTVGDVLRGVVDLTVDSSVLLEAVDFLINGEHQATITRRPFTFKWNTTGWPDGHYTVRIVGRNQAGTAETSFVAQVDNTPPTGQATVAQWSTTPLVTIHLQGHGATRVQFSNGWVWQGEDLFHQEWSGETVADPDALNGMAWRAAAGVHNAGAWYGPYATTLPTYRPYQIYFRLKTPDHAASEPLALLDVADDGGRRVYAERTLWAGDFATRSRYQEFRLDIDYQQPVPDGGDRAGIEFRTFYRAQADLYLDRVSVFSAPQPLAPTVVWEVLAVEGPQVISVRVLDDAGNSHDTSVALNVDMTPPEVLHRAPNAITVRDTGSGLDTSTAMYSYQAQEGSSWSAWQPLAVPATFGTTEAVVLQVPPEAGERVRIRVRDVAGNLRQTQTYESDHRSVMIPLIMR